MIRKQKIENLLSKAKRMLDAERKFTETYNKLTDKEKSEFEKLLKNIIKH